MALSTAQQGVLRGVIGAATVTVVVLTAGAAQGGAVLPPDLSSPAQRLAFALRCDLLLGLWLAYSIGRLARHRFFTTEDIDGGGLGSGTQRARVLQATLQNTLEQTVLAVFAHAIWAVLAPASTLGVVPAAVLLFLTGRFLFLRGYEQGAAARALGFGLTFYPSLLMLGLAVLLVARNPFG